MNLTATVQADTPGDGLMQFIDFQQVYAHIELLRLLQLDGSMSALERRALFFEHILGIWYNNLCEGMDLTTGHILYRLAELLDPEEQAAIIVFTVDEDKISLDDWRRDWASDHADSIPSLRPADLESARRVLMGD